MDDITFTTSMSTDEKQIKGVYKTQTHEITSTYFFVGDARTKRQKTVGKSARADLLTLEKLCLLNFVKKNRQWFSFRYAACFFVITISSFSVFTNLKRIFMR